MNLLAYVCLALAAVLLGPALTHTGFNGASIACATLAVLAIAAAIADLLSKDPS